MCYILVPAQDGVDPATAKKSPLRHQKKKKKEITDQYIL